MTLEALTQFDTVGEPPRHGPDKNLLCLGKKDSPVTQELKEKVMCLKPEPINPVPAETARIAKAAFPRGSTFIRMRPGAWHPLYR